MILSEKNKTLFYICRIVDGYKYFYHKTLKSGMVFNVEITVKKRVNHVLNLMINIPLLNVQMIINILKILLNYLIYKN